MHDSERLLITGEIGLVILGLAGLFSGQPQLAYSAVGAFVGLLAGHLNGRRS